MEHTDRRLAHELRGTAEDLCYLSAGETLRRFRDRSLSPVELMEALIRRAESVEPQLNAFSFTFFDQALEAARAAANRYVRGGDPPRALEGIPVAVKELSAVAGQPQTLGSRVFQGHTATHTDPALDRILSAGGIVHARTTTPEFGCASFTHSDLFGLTRNPWNLAYSPAGSSGGAAAALAAGTTVLAQGTDSAGSLRLPASACGVVGFKPSFGRIPLPSPSNMERCNHHGPMARSVEDVALLYHAMAGRHVDDINSWLPEERPRDSAVVPTHRLRAALVNVPAGLDVDPEVRANVARTAIGLESKGVVIETAELDWDYASILEATKAIYTATYAPLVRRAHALRPGLLTSYAEAFLRDVAEVGQKDDVILRGNEIVAKLGRELGRVFEAFDLLLLPTLCFPAPIAGEEYAGRGPVVCDREQPDRWIVGTTVPFNLVSSCPALNVPSGRNSEGVPTGLQIVGRPYRDADVLAIAALATAEDDWYRDPALRPPLGYDDHGR